MLEWLLDRLIPGWIKDALISKKAEIKAAPEGTEFPIKALARGVRAFGRTFRIDVVAVIDD